MKPSRKKIYVGTGENAALLAKTNNASKATCSRIRNGRQNFYFARYHELQREGNHLPKTSVSIYNLIAAGIRTVWPKINDFDFDDVAQETAIRIMGLPACENPDITVVYWAKRTAQTFMKKNRVRLNLFTCLSGENYDTQSIY